MQTETSQWQESELEPFQIHPLPFSTSLWTLISAVFPATICVTHSSLHHPPGSVHPVALFKSVSWKAFTSCDSTSAKTFLPSDISPCTSLVQGEGDHRFWCPLLEPVLLPAAP